MSKHLLVAFLFAAIIPACTTAEPELVEVAAGKADTWNTTPRGDYAFAETLSGQPSSGDLLTLSLAPSGAFKATISDELSGTTSHSGSYKLLQRWDETAYYIEFRERSQSYRFEYSIDLVDNATLWLRREPAQPWYGMWSLGADCTVSGCATGESCNECWGESVCLPDGTSC